LRDLGRTCALVIAVIGLSKLAGLLGWDPGDDQFLFRDKLGALVPPNRMAPNTALTLVFIGVSLWLLGAATPGQRDRAQLVGRFSDVGVG
jgi:hypothetical protein